MHLRLFIFIGSWKEWIFSGSMKRKLEFIYWEQGEETHIIFDILNIYQMYYLKILLYFSKKINIISPLKGGICK